MARCPKLEFESGGIFSTYKYKCELTGIVMYEDDPKCKYVCKPDSGYEYENCPIYKDR